MSPPAAVPCLDAEGSGESASARTANASGATAMRPGRAAAFPQVPETPESSNGPDSIATTLRICFQVHKHRSIA